MKTPNQLVKEEARRLFDYRDGMLFWRHAASGRRQDLLAITSEARGKAGGNKYYVWIGGTRFQAHYVIWNWHYGVTQNAIRFSDGSADNLKIENLIEVAVTTRGKAGGNKYHCPCCEQRVASPTPDIIAELVGLPPIQEAVLRAVWAGKGRPVQPEAIFTEMYSDDPDGGPGASKMYAAFKVALCHLREKLKGTGVSIENVGYRQGYRLIMKEARGQDGGVSQQGDDHRERGARP